jgi:Ran GTPase-activating protein (RanGAP) involved in mRNA processing and transport
MTAVTINRDELYDNLTYVDNSKIKDAGKGLFAATNIKKGDTIAEFKQSIIKSYLHCGTICYSGEIYFYDKKCKAHFTNDIININSLRDIYNSIINGESIIKTHDKIPLNSSISGKKINDQVKIYLVAQKDIASDEEIYTHYGLMYWLSQAHYLQKNISGKKYIADKLSNNEPLSLLRFPDCLTNNLYAESINNYYRDFYSETGKMAISVDSKSSLSFSYSDEKLDFEKCIITDSGIINSRETAFFDDDLIQIINTSDKDKIMIWLIDNINSENLSNYGHFLYELANEIKYGAASTAYSLLANVALPELDLWANNIGPEGAASIAKALFTNATLTKLNLMTNNIGPEGAASIAKALLTNATLAELNLRDNNIGPEGAASIAKALHTNATLAKLNLRDNNIGPEGAASISHSLLTNMTLAELNLRDNNIGPEGAASIAKALHTNATLTKLNLEYNNIGPEGAASIAKALFTNATLTILNLRANNIGPEGAASITKTLLTNATLTKLNLRANNIGPEGAASIAHTLPTNMTLTELDLRDNNIGSKGIASIVNILINNFKLTKIILDDVTNAKITKIINYNKKIFDERRFRYTKSIFNN